MSDTNERVFSIGELDPNAPYSTITFWPFSFSKLEINPKTVPVSTMPEINILILIIIIIMYTHLKTLQ